MIASIVLVWSLVLILLVMALRRPKGTMRKAYEFSMVQARVLVLRLPIAILASSFLVEIVPPEAMKSVLGEESGIAGIFYSSVAGAILPGGPFASFPIAVAFYKAGAGAPQMIALLTGWSIWAFHRALSYELPMMGTRFIMLRIASSCFLPPMAGLACMLAMQWITLP